MRRCIVLLFAALLAGCDAEAERALQLVNIESAETGLSLRELPAETLKSIGLSYGLAVVRTGASAERAGLRIGDVIFGINQNRVKSLEEFNRLLAQRADGRLGFLVRRGRTDFYVAVDLSALPRPGPSPRETLLRT
jgi:S1-C subfamily serine protease